MRIKESGVEGRTGRVKGMGIKGRNVEGWIRFGDVRIDQGDGC